MKFKWSDLDGKTLKINVAKSIDGISVIGTDESTGSMYVLKQRVFPEGPLTRGLASESEVFNKVRKT